MNNSYKLIGVLPLLLLAIIFVGVVSASSGVINTFLTYDDASATSKTVTQGDSVNLYLVAYGHGEQLYSEKLELVSSTLIFQENLAGDKIDTYTWLYSKVYALNTGILTPGTYTLRFTAVTKTTKSSEYSDLQLIILPKVIQPICGDNKINQANEQCDAGSLNGQVCSPLYGSTCTYCSNQCTSVTLNGPYCGDHTCNNGETCSTCASDCGACVPVCGNGIKETGEQCDDHNLNNNDGCSSTCKTEVCGDSIKQTNEQCDKGTVLNGQVCSPLYGSSCTYCSNSCTNVTLNGAYCGDHTCNGAETCSTCSGDCGTCPVQVCHIELTKLVSKQTAKPNDTITYTLKYKNTGNAVCTGGGVEIQDTLNSGLSYLGSFNKNILNDLDSDGLDAAWYATPGYDALTNTLTWNAHRVSPGEEGTITFNVKVLTPNHCGDFQIPNFFKAWSNEEQWKNSNTVTLSVDYNCPVQPRCGDHIINQANETCDDGNLNNNDGCSSTCKTEVCGDSIKQTNEQCDKGILNGQVCSPLYGSSCTYCSSSCTNVTLNGAYCGDSIKQTNEQCDDGNNVNGDGCSADCKTEVQKECILQLTKSVNDTNVVPGDMIKYTLKYKNIGNGECTGGGVKIQDVFNSNLKIIAYSMSVTGDTDSQSISFGYYEIPAFNNSTNTLTLNAHLVSPGEEGIIMVAAKILEPSQCGNSQISNFFKAWSNEENWKNSNTINLNVDYNCPPQPKCGDNIINQANETCDKGILNGQVCSPLYGSSCTYCSNQCKNITLNGPHCGDNITQASEECDDGNLVNGDGCSSTCKTECPQPFCGDHTCNGAETCSTCASDCGVCPTPKPECNINHFVQFCDTNWKCSGWSECSNGIMTRNCVDKNNCDTEYNKPYEEAECNGKVLSNAYVEGNVNYFWIILVAVLLIFILIIVLRLLK